MTIKITGAAMAEILEEMSEEGREEVEQLVAELILNFKMLPKHKQLGRRGALELIGSLLVFASRPKYEVYGELLLKT